MDQLRNTLATIQKYLGQLTLTHKLLVAMVAVIAVMSLLLVWTWSAKQEYAEFLPRANEAEQTKAAEWLRDHDVTPLMKSGRPWVPAAQHHALFSQYAQSGNLPQDTSMLFQGMLERQTWYTTRQQNDQTYNLALQNELSAVISKFNGISKATVIIDAPERQGLGAGSRKPTASATVFAEGKGGLDQATVDAIAALIAGSKAGLTIESIRVIDGNLRRQRRATAMEDLAASTYLEDVTKWENVTREKLVTFLSYIPEVMVAVTAQIDNSRLNRTREEFLPKDSGTISLIKRERGSSQIQAGAAPGGEVGIRSNVGMDVNSTSTSQAPANSTKEDESEFLNFPGRVQDVIVDNKGRPSMVAVSVNVPRAFVASQIPAVASTNAAAGAEANAGPTDDQLNAKFEKDIRPKIIESIVPHVKAMIASANPGLSAEELNRLLLAQVSVSMIPLDVVAFSMGSGSGSPGTSGSSGGTGSSSLPFGLSTAMVENAVIGGMALLAMGMMVVMVRRAGTGTTIPSPEEIVGMPPALATKNDLIGEADESDAPMMGIEVDDAEVRNTKMLDQVTDWVKGSPEGAAKLLNRWIATEP